MLNETTYDPFDHNPLYTTEDGRTGHDPLELLKSGKMPLLFSRSKLAMYLSPPAVNGEFQPDSPWQGVRRIRHDVPWPQLSSSNPEEIVDRFREAVGKCIEKSQSEVVAVTFSGGLDSLAVLLHASEICRSQGRRIIPIVANMRDNNGIYSGDVAQQLIDNLGIHCNLQVVDAEAESSHCYPEPDWDAIGPRSDAMPRVNRAIAALALELGAGMLLSGSGSDELLGAVRYMSSKLNWKQKVSYWRDIAEGGRMRLFAEGLSGIQWPRRLGTKIYWATNWPELCDPRPSDILGDVSAQVEQWSKDWIRQKLAFHEKEHHGDWAVTDCWDSVFPADIVPSAGLIPESTPFMEKSFATFAMALPITARYDGRLAHAYHRRKAMVIKLLPERVWPMLPRQKQLYSNAFKTYAESIRTAERCEAYGLIKQGSLETCDSTFLHRIQAIETWIAGAENIGAHLTT